MLEFPGHLQEQKCSEGGHLVRSKVDEGKRKCFPGVRMDVCESGGLEQTSSWGGLLLGQVTYHRCTMLANGNVLE